MYNILSYTHVLTFYFLFLFSTFNKSYLLFFQVIKSLKALKMADTRLDIVELKSSNFARWRNDVQVALIVAQCSDAVEHEAKPDAFPDDQWLVISRNARAIILKALRDDYWRVAPGDSPYQIMATIEDAFRPTSSLIAIMKLCKFFSLSQGVSNGDVVKEITSAFAELQHSLHASPVLQQVVTIDPSVRTAILAFALEKTDPTAAAQIKDRFEKNEITFEQAVSLLAEIRVTHGPRITGNPSVNTAQTDGNACVNCNGRHPVEKCWFRDPSLAPERLRSKICTKCKKIGHPTKSCTAFPASSSSVSAASTNVHFSFGVRHLVYSASSADSATVIVDSGATIHMMHDKSLFSSYVSGPPSVTHSVYTASGQSLPVAGYGTITLQITNARSGKKHTLDITDALHVPDLKENLLSVAALDRKGLELTTANGKMIARHNGQFVASASLNSQTSQYHLSYSKV